MQFEQRRTWRNHTGNQSCQPLRIYHPATVAEVVHVVREAERCGCTVRAVGSAHSWSDIALTTGFLLTTWGLGQPLDLEPGLLGPSAAGHHLVRVAGGMRIRALNAHLHQLGLALPNMGGYDGQTIAGVIATSTHGSGLGFGPLADLVRSVELVAAGGRRYRVEPTAGLADPARWNAAHPDVTLVQDDTWFRAVKVGLGSLGIVTAVTLEVEPSFWLTERRTLSSWTAVREAIRDPAAIRRHRHYEVYVNPHPRDGDRRCLVTTRERAGRPDEASGRGRMRTVANDLAALQPVVHFALNALFTLWPDATPALLDRALGALCDDEFTDLSYRVLNIGAPNYIPAYSSELAVPLDGTHIEAMERIFAIAESRRQAGRVYHTSPISLRFVHASDAWLSMMEGRDTMMIELIMMTRTEGGMELLAAYEEALVPLGVRPHWGQVNGLNGPEQVRALYPHLDRWLDVRRALDPAGLFDSPATRRLGLGTAPGGARP